MQHIHTKIRDYACI